MAADNGTLTLPPVAAILTYVRAPGSNWNEWPQGSHGALFTRAGFKVYVPNENHKPSHVRGALKRLAKAEGRELAEIVGDILAAREPA